MADHRAFDLEAGLVGRYVFGHTEQTALVDFAGGCDFHGLVCKAAANCAAGSVFIMSAGPSHPRRAVDTPYRMLLRWLGWCASVEMVKRAPLALAVRINVPL